LSRLILICLTLAVLGLGAMTAAGLFGPWSVAADAFSHFRIHLAIVALLLAACALSLNWQVSAIAAVIALVNFGLAFNYDRSPRVRSADGTALKVMTINVLYRVDNDEQILAQIAVENPDVVFFQELTRARAGLLDRLQALYPWQISCAGDWKCDVAIVSRHRWESAQAQPVGATRTKMAWARFGPEWSNTLVASVHLQWPLVSDQSAQLQSVTKFLANHRGPVIVAGDLNAAPWSAAVRSFTRQAHLFSAGGFVPTWPRRTFGQGQSCVLCVPQLQIDHVFVSTQFRVLSVRSGADVGSDHLPLIAELELPRSLAATSTLP
jgi:endonuclease/exonuclease/phosphatase (EEP) superfamily protein YafD